MKPDIEEFCRFYDLLLEAAPDDYEPWLFRVQSGGKAPATKFGSWKDESARLDLDAAVEWMEEGGNIGIAGTADDELVNVDIDDEDETDIDDLKATLIGRSRSRTGVHAWYFAAEEIPNIPTDTAGEVRTSWQYVVAPGSYVETDPDDVPEAERELAGYYTIERAAPVTSIRMSELPDVFQLAAAPTEPDHTATEDIPEVDTGESMLWRVTARDVLRRERGDASAEQRFAALWHGSDTGSNMSISADGEFLHCWRHGVAHNGLMAMVMMSDERCRCEQIGAGHKGGSPSVLPNEKGRYLWAAWRYAKDAGLIPRDDPVPYAALLHIVREKELATPVEIPKNKDESLPRPVYKAALSVVESLGYKHGRTHAESSEADENANTGVSVDSGTDGLLSWEEIKAIFHDLNRQQKSEYLDNIVAKIDEEMSFLFDSQTEVLHYYDEEEGIFREKAEHVVKKLMFDNIGMATSTYWEGEIIDKLEVMNKVDVEAERDPAGYICFQNGVYDVAERELLPHSPDRIFLNKWQVEYDPDAECPRWDAFIDDILKTESDRMKLQEFVGYTLMGWDYSYHKALFIVGPTASGKSTMIRVIQQMLGDESYASATPQQLIYDDYAPASLYGRKANFRSDIPADSIKHTGMLKEIIGGDKIRANIKYKQPFEFEPKVKHYYAANQLPKITESDEAFFRRIMLLPVPTTVPVDDRDPHLVDKLTEELPGILNWALRGCTACWSSDCSPETCRRFRRRRHGRSGATAWAGSSRSRYAAGTPISRSRMSTPLTSSSAPRRTSRASPSTC
jgi:phage/plasmid primase, P4 family, C-terminal domain